MTRVFGKCSRRQHKQGFLQAFNEKIGKVSLLRGRRAGLTDNLSPLVSLSDQWCPHQLSLNLPDRSRQQQDGCWPSLPMPSFFLL